MLPAELRLSVYEEVLEGSKADIIELGLLPTSTQR